MPMEVYRTMDNHPSDGCVFEKLFCLVTIFTSRSTVLPLTLDVSNSLMLTTSLLCIKMVKPSKSADEHAGASFLRWTEDINLDGYRGDLEAVSATSVVRELHDLGP